MANLAIVNDGDSFPYTGIPAGLYNFQVSEIPSALGYILAAVADVLRDMPDWAVDDSAHSIRLTGGRNTLERSRLIATTVSALRDMGRFDILKTWRNETFAIYGPEKKILFHIERSACPLFGLVTYGVHAIAFVPPQIDDGELRVWVSRRAKKKQTFGGMLDSTAAGGIASDETPFQALVKECLEEASLSPEFVRSNAKAAGVVTHFYVRDERAGGEVGFLQPEAQYVYDIPLPPHMICRKNEDEVDEFGLWTTTEIREALQRRQFKPNSALVMLDFLIRHGIITPDNEPDYLEIVARLHRRLVFPMR